MRRQSASVSTARASSSVRDDTCRFASFAAALDDTVDGSSGSSGSSRSRILTTYLLPVVACRARRTSPWVPSPILRPKMSCFADVRGTRAALAGRERGLDLRRRAEAPGAVASCCFEPPMTLRCQRLPLRCLRISEGAGADLTEKRTGNCVDQNPSEKLGAKILESGDVARPTS